MFQAFGGRTRRPTAGPAFPVRAPGMTGRGRGRGGRVMIRRGLRLGRGSAFSTAPGRRPGSAQFQTLVVIQGGTRGGPTLMERARVRGSMRSGRWSTGTALGIGQSHALNVLVDLGQLLEIVGQDVMGRIAGGGVGR